MYENDDLLKLVESLQQEVTYLNARVATLESNRQMVTNGELPRTWLLSQNMLKRAFGVYGLNLLAGILIVIPFFCLYLILVVALGVTLGGFQ